MPEGLNRLWLLLLMASRPVLATDDWGDDAWGDEEQQRTQLHGFLEMAGGSRTSSDSFFTDDKTLAELRGRVEAQTYVGDSRYSAKVDLYADAIEGGVDLDVRELMLEWSATDNIDLRLGHQVLTWGTGDLLFLNDLFAKDWQSFFSGRDDEYLKAPSTSFKLSYYGEQANLDLVWTPVFESDRFINGERFSYFSPLSASQQAAPEGTICPDYPDKTLSNGEFAARLHGTTSLMGEGTTEWAVYAYHGYWKQPNALNTKAKAYFTDLNSLGASLRSNVLQGIGHAEIAWYNGEDDQGDNPMLPNNQLRLLLGYEQELLPKLTLGLQFYREHILDYAALTKTDGNSIYRPDENRDLWTLRVSYRTMQDNLTFSWFSFYSPTDQDYYHRPSVKYRFNDQLSLSLGGNVFGGQQAHSFFGQFEDASNLYARLRWSY